MRRSRTGSLTIATSIYLLFTAPVSLGRAAGQTASNASPSITPVAFTTVAQLGSCDVLFLDLGPLSLNLLGLTVDLSQVILDINAVQGPGNLLGNLLCALLGLLDITALLTAVTQLLDVINGILGGLSGAGVGGGAAA